MIFKLTQGQLKETKTDYSFNELQLEKLVIGSDDIHELNFNIFNESFLYLGRQVSKIQSFATFYALDSFGRGVIIEINKDQSATGTHCLTTVNQISPRVGEHFIHFCLGRRASEDEVYLIKQFISCEYTQINNDSRVVLLANAFDPSVFNLGQWFSENHLAFKAIRYFSTKFNFETLVDFSTLFETFSKYSYALKNAKNFKVKESGNRKPTVFFHDIGHADEKWWNYLQKFNVITASYDNFESAASQGYHVLSQYIPGDIVIAFAKDIGVVGYGAVTSKGYAYKDHEINDFAHSHFHTMSVQWDSVLTFSLAISMNRVIDLGLKNPVQTKQEIRFNKGTIDTLLNEIKIRFNSKNKVA